MELTAGAQGGRECPSANVLRSTPEPDDGQVLLPGVVGHVQVESNTWFTSHRHAWGSAGCPAWPTGPRFESRIAASRMPSVIGFVGRPAAQEGMRPPLVVPFHEASQFGPDVHNLQS